MTSIPFHQDSLDTLDFPIVDNHLMYGPRGTLYVVVRYALGATAEWSLLIVPDLPGKRKLAHYDISQPGLLLGIIDDLKGGFKYNPVRNWVVPKDTEYERFRVYKLCPLNQGPFTVTDTKARRDAAYYRDLNFTGNPRCNAYVLLSKTQVGRDEALRNTGGITQDWTRQAIRDMAKQLMMNSSAEVQQAMRILDQLPMTL